MSRMTLLKTPRLLPVLLLSLGGNVAIYFGFAFINARPLPHILARFYGATTPGLRTAVMVMLFAVPADYAFALCFRMISPSLAAMAILATLVVTMIGNALLLEGALSPRAWISAIVTILAAGWFGYEQAICG